MFVFSGELIFPVLFVYPEVGETDFIEEWRESETFAQHLGTRHDFPINISSDILIVCLRVFHFHRPSFILNFHCSFNGYHIFYSLF
jgi:hypothetical protein